MPDDGGRASITPRPSFRGVLLTPRWVGMSLLAVALAVGMVFLGIWQLHRYELRSTINARIDNHAHTAPVPATGVLHIGAAPADRDQYRRVTMTGRYDPAHRMLARTRTVDDKVGYEILVPLRLSNGAAVLVDRGWLPPGTSDPVSEPDIPAAPTGRVTVVGQVRLPESGAKPPTRRDGHLEVRRIDPAALAATLPYRAYGGYVTLTEQKPAAATQFVAIPIQHQNAAMNLSYIVQWWLFSGMAVVGFVLLVRWESRKRAGLTAAGAASRPQPGQQHDTLSDDRV